MYYQLTPIYCITVQNAVLPINFHILQNCTVYTIVYYLGKPSQLRKPSLNPDIVHTRREEGEGGGDKLIAKAVRKPCFKPKSKINLSHWCLKGRGGAIQGDFIIDGFPQ